MIIPVRCFSCGKPIGHMYEDLQERTIKKKEDRKKVLDSLGADRYCCRAQILGHVELIDIASQFKKF
ncbi:MAG: DNA-directed RNA polymerase subunit N [Nanoarchaeota archaeon]